MRPFSTLGTIAAASLAFLGIGANAGQYVLIVPLTSNTVILKGITVDLSASSLPAANVGVPYQVDLRNLLRIQGDPHENSALVRWSVSQGELPQGISLGNGILTGTPAKAENAFFSVQVTYKTKSGTQTYSIPVDLSVTLAPAGRLEAVVGQAMTPFDFTQLLSSDDGRFTAAAATWDVAPNTPLPAGLVLTSSGLLQGRPTTAFEGSITVRARYKGATGQQAYDLAAREITIAFQALTPLEGRLAMPYQFDLKQSLSVTGDPAYTPAAVAFSTNSALPAGLTLSTGGVISGTPSEKSYPPAALSVEAAYRGVKSTVNLSIAVKVGLAEISGAKAWADGSTAASCNDYRNPSGAYVYEGATGDGVYKISPAGIAPFNVRCDQSTDGGGWTVIQRRYSGAQDFNKGFAEYVNGFGDTSGEYWLGLDRIHALTADAKMLRIDLGRFSGNTAYAIYENFSVGTAPDYLVGRMPFVGGPAGDSFYQSTGLGVGFSTYDRDVDTWKSNCAQRYSGGWWFQACHAGNLNGDYLGADNELYAKGITWLTFNGYYESLASSEMKVR